MIRVTLYPYPKPSGYYPVNKYGLLIYNKFGYVGNSTSTRNIQLRRTSDNAIQDFLFDKNSSASVAAVNAWRGGSDIRLVRLYNEGVGGSAYDLIQNTSGEQPFIDTITWTADFSAGNYYLDSASNPSITNKNSIMIAAFISSSFTLREGVLVEYRTSNNLIANMIMADATNNKDLYWKRSPALAPEYIKFQTQQPNSTPRVYAVRKFNDDYSGYADNSLIGNITDTEIPAIYNTTLRLGGTGTAYNLFFRGKSKGYIVHNNELTIPILFELSTHLGS